MKIKNSLIILGLLLLIVAIGGCGKDKQEKNKLRIASSPVLCEAPIHIAAAKGFF